MIDEKILVKIIQNNSILLYLVLSVNLIDNNCNKNLNFWHIYF